MFTVPGNVTSDTPEYSNALLPIPVIVLGIVSLFNGLTVLLSLPNLILLTLLTAENANSPIVLTLLGITISFMFLSPL